MQLRDLSKRQLYNIRRRSGKERKEYANAAGCNIHEATLKEIWEKAYAKGFRAALELIP